MVPDRRLARERLYTDAIMIRIIAFLTLVVLLSGCARYHTRAQGPFSRPTKEPPPPYGAPVTSNALQKPLGNQSPLGLTSAGTSSTLAPTSEPPLIPPPRSEVIPAGGEEVVPDEKDGVQFPLRRRPPLFPRKDAAKDPPKAAPKEEPGEPAKVNVKNLAQVKELLAAASAAWKKIDTYEATLTRRELNPKGDINSDSLLLQYRREPMSVFTRTLSGTGKGRETVYYPGKHGDKMHIMLGEGDSRLAKPGFIAPPISPDDPRIKEKARFSIRDVGFGRTINELTSVLAKIEGGKLPGDALVYNGEKTRDESTYPLVCITQTLRAGDDALFPIGGTRWFFFDMKKDSPSFAMPVLMMASDSKGKELEYYHFEKVKSPANLSDEHFHPSRLGKK